MRWVGFAVAGAFGGFLAYCDIFAWDWRFWVLIGLFFAYGFVQFMEGSD